MRYVLLTMLLLSISGCNWSEVWRRMNTTRPSGEGYGEYTYVRIIDIKK